MIRSLFSTRAVVIVTGILAFIFASQGTQRILGDQIDFQTILIGILIATRAFDHGQRLFQLRY